MSERERRLAQNEVVFRLVNSEIAKIGASLGDDGEMYGFVCECSDVACSASIQVRLAEFRRIRSHPEWFVVASGHDDQRIERVVERREGYVVVEKVGEAAAVARAASA